MSRRKGRGGIGKKSSKKSSERRSVKDSAKKIASAFKNYEDEQGFSRVVGIEEISKNNYSLNIPLYARKRMDIPPALSPGEAADKWAVQRAETTQSIDSLLELLS